MSNQIKTKIIEDLGKLFTQKDYKDIRLIDVTDGVISYLMVTYLQSAIGVNPKLFAIAQTEMIPELVDLLKQTVDDVAEYMEDTINEE